VANEFLKRVRREIKRGVTIEGGYGPGFIVKSGAKFVCDKGWINRIYIKLKGEKFEGRVYVIEQAKLEGKPSAYNVRFKQNGGSKYYYTVKYFKGIAPAQLTAVLDAVVNGTGDVKQVKEVEATIPATTPTICKIA
jgi:hypothetical protein